MRYPTYNQCEHTNNCPPSQFDSNGIGFSSWKDTLLSNKLVIYKFWVREKEISPIEGLQTSEIKYV